MIANFVNDTFSVYYVPNSVAYFLFYFWLLSLESKRYCPLYSKGMESGLRNRSGSSRNGRPGPEMDRMREDSDMVSSV